MKIGILGTGLVGRTLGDKFLQLGHSVTIGSRGQANPEVKAWAEAGGENAALGTFAVAAEFGELVFNATSGTGSLEAIGSCPAESVDGKVLVDVSNPLDFSRGFPPTLAVSNDDSLGERIQAAHPAVLVVKTFNTLSANVMVNPSLVPGHHNVFLSGNHAAAKASVADLQHSMGWPREDIIDLGDITTSRGTEMYLPLWLRLFGALGAPNFNISVVRG